MVRSGGGAAVKMSKLEMLLDDKDLRTDVCLLSSAIVSLGYDFNPERENAERIMELASIFLKAKNIEGLSKLFTNSNGQMPALSEAYKRFLTPSEINSIADRIFGEEEYIPEEGAEFLKLAPEILIGNERVTELIKTHAENFNALNCAIVLKDGELIAEALANLVTHYISHKAQSKSDGLMNEYKTEEELTEKIDLMVPPEFKKDIFVKASYKLLERRAEDHKGMPMPLHEQAAEYALKSQDERTITAILSKLPTDNEYMGPSFMLAEYLYKNSQDESQKEHLKKLFTKKTYTADCRNKKFIMAAAELLGDFESLRKFFLEDLAENRLYQYQAEEANKVFKALAERNMVKTGDVVASIETYIANNIRGTQTVGDSIITLNVLVPENRQVNREIFRAAIQAALELKHKEEALAGLNYLKKCGLLTAAEERIYELATDNKICCRLV